MKTRSHRKGFALVATLMLMILLVIIAVGLLGLSTIELRKSGSEKDMAIARANARLAMMQAINQLQMELGPDQRVSAPSSLLTDAKQKHWTGTFSSLRKDGTAIWTRDPDTGSLIDNRNDDGWKASDRLRSWLVSGNGDPTVAGGDTVELVGSGSAGDDENARVRVPLVKVTSSLSANGRMAWWTGDLGQRANISVADVHDDHKPDPDSPANGGYFRMLASQQAETAVMNGGKELNRDVRMKLPSNQSADLAISSVWRRDRFHDFTTLSAGVLADPQNGGLKKDLTAFFESDGKVVAEGPMAGLADGDPIMASGAATRFGLSSPRFGDLRDWVRSAPKFAGKKVAAIRPEVDPSGGTNSKTYAFCNTQPVRIKNSTRSNRVPVLVEASNMMQPSVYLDRIEKAADGSTSKYFQWRVHNYPRIVLWNPYNVELDMEPVIVMMQGNGRQEVWTDDYIFDNDGNKTATTKKSQWLFFEGGRSTSFAGSITQSAGYNDPYIGSYYYSIPRVLFGPGECLVFSPKKSAEYDGLSVYRPGNYDLSKNELSCEVAPDVSRSYYITASEIKGGSKTCPFRFWFDATKLWSTAGRDGIENQGDDNRVVMKALEGGGPVTFEKFDSLPQISYISGSLQYGAGREPRVAWNSADPMPVELLEKSNPEPREEPNVRTRDGLRMRWFNETLSNRINSGALANAPRYLEDALLANWNPRAAYAIRSPWENIGGSLPVAGASGGGPWFFGAYMRDLFDQAVGWGGGTPVVRQGRQHGNPFGPPQEGQARYVVFELPRDETGVVSMGQMQHAKISEFIWHPSFAIGNSLADPRLGLADLNKTVPPSPSSTEDKLGGFHRNAIGWAKDTERSKNRDEWAITARAMLQDLPDRDQVVYDLSFEANHALWDRYFISSGDAAAKQAFLDSPDKAPLPNGRMKPALGIPLPEKSEVLENYHQSARHLMVEGSFNVNSTSVEAWKAMLAATRSLGGKETPFPRFLKPEGGTLGEGDDAESSDAWSGTRALSDGEIGKLAAAIVEEVKLRGPFLSLSDFVNRRLRNDESGHCGALQAAIDRAGINSEFEQAYPLDRSSALTDYKHPDNIKDATRLEQTLKPATKAWGAPGFLTQGDVMQVLGPVLNARSDSFVVRGYGEAVDSKGKVLARAWCEAVVQRTPEPLLPDVTGINPDKAGQAGDFGRRFAVVSFRWLRQEEI